MNIKPDCYDEDDWSAWNFYNGNTQRSERARCHCHDCQPWFADAMQQRGLCHPPEVIQRRTCKVCGHGFFPAAPHVGTCDQCKSNRQQQAIAQPVVSICTRCGHEYTGNTGWRGICYDCIPAHRKAYQRRKREERRAASV